MTPEERLVKNNYRTRKEHKRNIIVRKEGVTYPAMKSIQPKTSKNRNCIINHDETPCRFYVPLYKTCNPCYTLINTLSCLCSAAISGPVTTNSPARIGREQNEERSSEGVLRSKAKGRFLRMIGRRAGTNRVAEFEILFVLFFVIAYVIFKDLTARPEYNRILVEKPAGYDIWPF
ncbi:hypothetical protein Bca101_084075 [Brassica carinata]